MVDLAFWPWGLIIVSLLSIAIGWLVRDILGKRQMKQKKDIIQAQEREYVKLAQKHVESRQSDKSVIGQQEERLSALSNTLDQMKASQNTTDTSATTQEDKELIRQLHDELDRLRIENQKLSSVPKALFVEKNKALKSELKELKKKLQKSSSKDEALKAKNRRLKKKLKKLKKIKEHEVRIVEKIDFKKLKKILKNLPVKRSRVTIYSAKKDKKAGKKVTKSIDD